MEDPDDPQRRRSLKRSFDQISRTPPPRHSYAPSQQQHPQQQLPQQPQQQQQPAWTRNFANAVRNSSARFFPSSEPPAEPVQDIPARFVGDGIDTRRPAMSTTPVIDLTGSDSPEQDRSPQPLPPMRPFPGGLPPRLNREPSVIDLDTFNFESNSERATPPIDLTGPTPIDLEEGEDDDVLFVRENPRPQPPRPLHPNRPSNPPGPGPLPRHVLRRFLRFPGGIDNPQAIAQHEAALAGAQRRTEARWANLERGFQRHEQAMGSISGAPVMSRRPGASRTSNEPRERLFDGFGYFPTRHLPSFAINAWFGTAADVRVPANIDYETVPFDPATAMPTRPSRPTYEAPPPVQEGFTRSPKEDDVLVCPNCDHELGTGEGLDRQVWVIRECGHVYCGFCAKTRPVRPKPKNIPSKEERPREQEYLTQCNVSGCTSKATKKATMFQIWVNTD